MIQNASKNLTFLCDYLEVGPGSFMVGSIFGFSCQKDPHPAFSREKNTYPAFSREEDPYPGFFSRKGSISGFFSRKGSISGFFSRKGSIFGFSREKDSYPSFSRELYPDAGKLHPDPQPCRGLGRVKHLSLCILLHDC